MIPLQNFAVAPAIRGTRTRPRPGKISNPQEQQDSRERKQRLSDLVRERQDEWLRLFLEPDVWTDAEKRHAMMEARWAYHDAVAEWRSVCRDAKQADGEGPERLDA